MNIFVTIDGGAGKNIIFSAVAKAIKKQYPDSNLIVTTPYPEILLNNPNIYRVYKSGMTQYFYDDHIKGQDTLFLTDEPYKNHDFINRDIHIIETWCNTIGIPYNNETPELYINPLEIMQATAKLQGVQKPILFYQPFGGGIQDIKYSWNRDIPPAQAQQIANILSQKYHVIQIGRQDQITLANVNKVTDDFRSLFALLALSERRVLIDSVFQHAAAAIGLKSTVCWITNSPKKWGYEIHRNILPKEQIQNTTHNIDGFYIEHDFTGTKTFNYPFSDMDIFNVEEIVEPLMFT